MFDREKASQQQIYVIHKQPQTTYIKARKLERINVILIDIDLDLSIWLYINIKITNECHR